MSKKQLLKKKKKSTISLTKRVKALKEYTVSGLKKVM